MFFRRRIVNKDQLVDLAYNFIEENGYESLNEVSLAKKTHISKSIKPFSISRLCAYSLSYVLGKDKNLHRQVHKRK